MEKVSKNQARIEQHNRRHRKMMYKLSREALLETPPPAYQMGNIDPHGHESIGPSYDHEGRYYYVPSQQFAYPQFYEQIYYGLHPSQLASHQRKYSKDNKNIQYYAPFYGIPRIGTCPGCGGKTSLTPAKIPMDHMPPGHHDYEHDFLEKISPSAFTPLRSKHNSDSKHSSGGELGYPNFLSPAQALKKTELNNLEKGKNFCISDSKTPFRQTPTPKKAIDYCVSGAKMYKDEHLPVGELNSQLFSQDLGDDENNKSPFSFLKRASSFVSHNGLHKGTREAFNNITNTIHKSPFFEEREHNPKITENIDPKTLKFEHKE